MLIIRLIGHGNDGEQYCVKNLESCFHCMRHLLGHMLHIVRVLGILITENIKNCLKRYRTL